MSKDVLARGEAAEKFLSGKIEEKEADVGGTNTAQGYAQFIAADVGAAIADLVYHLPKTLITGEGDSHQASHDVERSYQERVAEDRRVIDNFKKDLAELGAAMKAARDTGGSNLNNPNRQGPIGKSNRPGRS